MASFRPNHKFFKWLCGKLRINRKNIQKFLEKTKFNENHKDNSDIEKSSFSTHFFVLCRIIVSDKRHAGLRLTEVKARTHSPKLISHFISLDITMTRHSKHPHSIIYIEFLQG
jgi:hypothetical protein